MEEVGKSQGPLNNLLDTRDLWEPPWYPRNDRRSPGLSEVDKGIFGASERH